MKILGIETSCDETAVAIVENGRKVHAHILFTQIAKHKKWGGVIPELASRMHLEVMSDLLDEAFETSNLSMDDIDAIAVTQGPGLIGSLMIGVNTAKTLAWVHKKKLLPINHLHGHVCANFIQVNEDDKLLEPPFICMLASGGHTQIIHMKSYTEFEILAETIDDAAGEAFDKVARLMELPYPGGPHLDKLAQSVDDGIKNEYSFPIAMPKSLDFSFSGLKTAVLRMKEKIGDEKWNEDKAIIASAFQNCIAKTFYKKVLRVCEELDLRKIVLAGGVAANSAIRKSFKENFSEQNGFELVVPSLKYCTDNAVMIASAGYFMAKEETDLNAAKNDYSFEVYSRV